ncbi:uncharacterized protein LOC104879798 isoform X1 [Vitis vinifera]|uniref:uncharacterized protein LOC104879798 isoform X1 n=1 Tax=Vitis vinifera TaxID=29760 RepID=UPI00053FCD0F|nr:uncharacterized protein LOC104879798 isoform X1 [Vitis vinifera]
MMQRHHTQSEIHLGFFALIRRIITSSLPSSPVLTVELQKMKMEAHEDEMRSLCVTLKPPDLNLFPMRYLFYGLRFTHKLVICLFISILGFPVQSIFSYFSFYLHFSYPSLHFANLGLWFGKKMLSVSDSLTRIDGPGFSGLQLKFLETHFIPDQRLALGKYKVFFLGYGRCSGQLCCGQD